MKLIPSKLHYYSNLMRLNKPIGLFLLLWPTLMALWIAGRGHPDTFVTFIFVAGVFVMRSAGCVINDYFDQKMDAKVERCKTRPLVQNKVTSTETLILFAVLISIAFILVLQCNINTVLLSCIALILATLYPLMKRYTHFPQVVLGAAFAWSIPMAFVAQKQSLNINVWILYLATLLWVVAYDTQYAMVDREDDLKIGVKSTAIYFGVLDCLMILILQLVSLCLFSILGLSLGFELYYFLGISLASLFVFYQQYLIKERNPENCFKAFLNNNYLGCVLFLGVFLEYCFHLMSTTPP